MAQEHHTFLAQSVIVRNGNNTDQNPIAARNYRKTLLSASTHGTSCIFIRQCQFAQLSLSSLDQNTSLPLLSDLSRSLSNHLEVAPLRISSLTTGMRSGQLTMLQNSTTTCHTSSSQTTGLNPKQSKALDNQHKHCIHNNRECPWQLENVLPST